MKIVVCVGSSCHLKGSKLVVERLRELIAEKDLGDKVEIGGMFCAGRCQKDVCVMIGDEAYSVTPASVDEFFASDVLGKL